jgi:hypothetical protein
MMENARLFCLAMTQINTFGRQTQHWYPFYHSGIGMLFADAADNSTEPAGSGSKCLKFGRPFNAMGDFAFVLVQSIAIVACAFMRAR